MNEFTSGPFLFEPFGVIKFGGADLRRWELSYGGKLLADRRATEKATQDQVREIFADDVASFVSKHRQQQVPAKKQSTPQPLAQLIDEATGRVLGQFNIAAPIAGLTAGLTDDRWPTWLVKSGKPTHAMPMGIDEFERLQAAHTAANEAADAPCPHQHVTAPANAWIAGLLPDEVLTRDASEWRAPTAWEIRHVVGEGSFTRVSGAKAAALVGILPQNFRKYTAADGAASRQGMSFAMWHLLLHRLGVQSA